MKWQLVRQAILKDANLKKLICIVLSICVFAFGIFLGSWMYTEEINPNLYEINCYVLSKRYWFGPKGGVDDKKLIIRAYCSSCIYSISFWNVRDLFSRIETGNDLKLFILKDEINEKIKKGYSIKNNNGEELISATETIERYKKERSLFLFLYWVSGFILLLSMYFYPDIFRLRELKIK